MADNNRNSGPLRIVREPRSAGVGRLPMNAERRDLRGPAPVVKFGGWVKPRSWPTAFWYKSKMYDRGRVSRRERLWALFMGRR